VEVLDSGKTSDCLMLRLNNRKVENLIPLIRKFVNEGVRIMTDEWRAYNTLRNWYQHSTVNHSQGFANEEGLTTNSIEGLWKHAWNFLPLGGTNIQYLNSYLFALCWKKKFGNKYEGWEPFLSHMALIYNPYRPNPNKYLEDAEDWDWYWNPPGVDPDLEVEDEEEKDEIGSESEMSGDSGSEYED